MFHRSVLRRCTESGAPPTGLSPAALELMKRLQATSVKKTKDPAKAVKLIDRLKDLHMQGHWARAMSLFDNHPAESRVWRWQSFHYRVLLQMLGEAKQTQHGLRVWSVMKERPEISLDEHTANDALVVLADADPNGACLQEVQQVMDERKFKTLPRAQRALDARRANDWQLALADLMLSASPETLGDAAASAEDGKTTSSPGRERIETELLLLLRRHSANQGAMAAIRAAMAAVGINEGGDVYSYRIRNTGTWEEATSLLAECVAKGTATVRTYNEALEKLHRFHEAPRMKAIIDDMNERKIQHNKFTVEVVMRYFETTPQWAEATQYFMAMKLAGVPPTNRGYGSLIKTYNRGGQASRVMPVFEAMRKDGFQGDARDTMALISAWSSNRLARMQRR